MIIFTKFKLQYALIPQLLWFPISYIKILFVLRSSLILHLYKLEIAGSDLTDLRDNFEYSSIIIKYNVIMARNI